MKSKVKFEAVATIGKYTDNQGQEKKRYLKCGTVFESEDGRLSMKLDAMPCGPDWSGYIQFFDIKPREGQQRAEQPKQSSMPPPRYEEDDDSSAIPF